MCAILEAKHGKLHIVGKVNDVDFEKKNMNCCFFNYMKENRKLRKGPCEIQLN